MYNLFLDDLRDPKNAFEITKLSIYINLEWEIVRNYNEFTEHIINNGIIKVYKL